MNQKKIFFYVFMIFLLLIVIKKSGKLKFKNRAVEIDREYNHDVVEKKEVVLVKNCYLWSDLKR